MATREDSRRVPRTAPEDPFDLVPEATEESASFSRPFLVFWGVALLAGFLVIDRAAGGFENMRKYGWDEKHTNYIMRLSHEEKLFMVALLLLLPAAVFLAGAFDESLGERLLRIGRRLAATARAARGFLVGITVVAALVITTLAFGVIRGAWITDDENVYVFQSRILASGHLTLPGLSEDDRIFNDNIFLVNDATTYGQYPIGHSFALLPGVLLGEPRIPVILAALLTILGIYLLGVELYDRATGLLAAAILVTSPAFLLMSATVLSHPVIEMFLTWFGLFCVRTMKTRSLRDAALAALFFGLAFHVRSVTAFLVAGPAAILLSLSLALKWNARGQGVRRIEVVLFKNLRPIAVLAAVIGASVGMYLLFNYWLNGSPFKTNYHAVWLDNTPHETPFGFGRGFWNIYHTPEAGLKNLVNNVLRLNVWMLGWPIGFLFVALQLASRRRTLADLALFAPVPASFAAYFFFFWPGVSDAGPVLYYELLVPLVLLTARGILTGTEWLKAWMPSEKAAVRLAAFVFFAVLLGAVSTTRTHVMAVERLIDKIREPYDLIANRGIKEGVVFMDYYVKGDYLDSWVAGRINTSPLLGDKLNFVLNLGAERDRAFLDKYFPGQEANVLLWSKDGPRLVALADYEENYVIRNYPEVR